MKTNVNLGILLLRLSVGVLMMMHGISKIPTGAAGIVKSFEKAGIPSFLVYSVFIGEILGPLMLIVGFRSRLGALLVAATMAVVMFFFKSGDFNQITKTGAWALELQALYLFGGLAIFFTGGGKYAMSTRHKWD